MGTDPGAVFEVREIPLRHGDIVFLYTDGVTEAMNPAAEFYGEPRMVEELERLRRLGCPDLLRGLRDSIRDFAAGAEQSDDITMLAFRFLGKRDDNQSSE